MRAKKILLAFAVMLAGIALMAYPYAVRGTLAIYAVGIALTGALYFGRE